MLATLSEVATEQLMAQALAVPILGDMFTDIGAERRKAAIENVGVWLRQKLGVHRRKIVVVGAAASGKTRFIKSLLNAPKGEEEDKGYVPTRTCQTHAYDAEHATIWDVPTNSAIGDGYYIGADAAIVLLLQQPPDTMIAEAKRWVRGITRITEQIPIVFLVFCGDEKSSSGSDRSAALSRLKRLGRPTISIWNDQDVRAKCVRAIRLTAS